MKGVFIFLIFFHVSSCLVSGQNRIFFSRRLAVEPLSILEYHLNLKCSSEAVKAYCFLRFYDSAQHELLEYKTGPDSAVHFTKAGYYTIAPPYSAYAVVTVEADSAGAGEIMTEGFQAELNIGVPSVKHAARYDPVQYLRPFWHSDTIFNETVLLYSRNGAPAAGNLLYRPDKILSVRSFDLQTSYSNARDYTFIGRTISRKPNSKMPFRADSSFDRQNLAWFNLQSQWVVITYTHSDTWPGPRPGFKGDKLPRTLSRLRSKSALRIVAYGMSITRGLDVSGYDSVAPYMPSYVDLFTSALKKAYGYSDIQLYNAALPGARIDWGARYAGQYINPLKPDLVILDFGMNDFWMYKPEEFKVFMQAIIHQVKAVHPQAEFMLLSNMQFDPDYVLDSDKNKAFYRGNLNGYHTVLREMETTGIVNLDMTSLSAILYARKKAKDCLSNPLHPNDYMARWYAQGMAALLEK